MRTSSPPRAPTICMAMGWMSLLFGDVADDAVCAGLRARDAFDAVAMARYERDVRAAVQRGHGRGPIPGPKCRR